LRYSFRFNSIKIKFNYKTIRSVFNAKTYPLQENHLTLTPPNQLIKVFVFLVFTGLSSLYSQNFELKGQFTGNNLEKSFINVINISTYKATISQKDGKFQISAKVGDSILISSIQYNAVKFVVKSEFKIQPIKIPLKLKVTELENVDIYSIGLSGDLEKDAQHIRIDETIDLNFSMRDLANAYDPEISARPEFTLRNIALEQNQPNLATNVNFIAIAAGLISLFKSKKGKPTKKIRDVENQYNSGISKLEDLEFYKSFLAIEKENIEEFIVFTNQNGLQEFLKTNPSEMDLIQFLVELSIKYNTPNASE